ncbi:MAG: MFS transporter [Halobacteriales archaeon]
MVTEPDDGTETESTERPATSDGPPAARSDRAMWGLVAGASLIAAALGAYEIAPASVTPLIRESLGIGATAAGLLVGVMFAVAVVASVPVGVVLDRTDTRLAMALSVVAVFVVGLWGWWAARAGAYGSLLASRVVGGTAFIVVWNAGIDIVGEAASESRRATVVALFTASAPLGFALGQGLSPAIAARWGWPAIFVAFNGLALLGLVLFWPASRGLGAAGGETPTLAEFGRVLRSRRVWIVGGLGFLGYGLYLFVNSWGPSYLTTEVGISLGLSGLLIALFPAVGVVSRASGGLLSDRLFDGRRRPVALVTFLVAAPLLVAFPLLRSVAALVVGLLVAGFAIQLVVGLSFAYVRELVDPRVAATAVAFQAALGMGGATVSPIVGGAVIDAAGYPAAFVGAGAMAAVGVGLAWVAPESGGRRREHR